MNGSMQSTARDVRCANSTTMSPVGDAYEEIVAGEECLRVQVLAAGEGRYAYLAQCGYQACDGPFRDRVTSTETFADAAAALAAGIVKARQLAGIDVPEA